MRQITRRFLVVLTLVFVALLALGALPSYLASGDAYHLTATETNASGPAVDATELPTERYPHTTAALTDGRSSDYRRGPWGLKEAFTHSPFDEIEALATRNRAARMDDGSVLVEYKGERYRLEVTQS